MELDIADHLGLRDEIKWYFGGNSTSSSDSTSELSSLRVAVVAVRRQAGKCHRRRWSMRMARQITFPRTVSEDEDGDLDGDDQCYLIIHRSE